MRRENEYVNMKLPKKLYEEIEQKVTSLYMECKITSMPIDPFEICRSRGYISKPFSSFSNKEISIFRRLELDGLNFYDDNLCTHKIYYDDKQTPERIRFTIMHEIGHIDLGHREDSGLAEKIANHFAGYALAPSPIIYLMECDDYMDIAKNFRVSEPCADICFQRFMNWKRYSGELKPYEKDLLGLFHKKRIKTRCCV